MLAMRSITAEFFTYNLYLFKIRIILPLVNVALSNNAQGQATIKTAVKAFHTLVAS